MTRPGAAAGTDAGFGVYLHIPFCARRCDYCAFATWTDKSDLVEAYVAACLAEIETARREGRLRPASSIFFGGGTPSLLPASLLTKLLGAIERVDGAEVTVECNPESTSLALLEPLVEAGVTRISLGVQSLVPHVLAGLGRSHRPGDVEAAVAAIGAAGLQTFNVDLIYGGAGETDADWLTTLEGVLALEPRPPHVSAYALTVEAGTPLARDPSRHPDDDVQADRYARCDQLLGMAGLRWYEISNWALPGHECRHNLSCWQGGEYLGIGCAAHSHLDGRRFFNVRPLERYIARIRGGASAVAGSEELSTDARALERLELALRTSAGVPGAALAEDPMLEDLVERIGSRAMLSRRGRLLANEVALRLRVPAGRSANDHFP